MSGFLSTRAIFAPYFKTTGHESSGMMPTIMMVGNQRVTAKTVNSLVNRRSARLLFVKVIMPSACKLLNPRFFKTVSIKLCVCSISSRWWRAQLNPREKICNISNVVRNDNCCNLKEH